MNILQINSSIFSEGGQSSRLADQLVERLRGQNPGASLTVRDLTRCVEFYEKRVGLRVFSSAGGVDSQKRAAPELAPMAAVARTFMADADVSGQRPVSRRSRIT